MAEYKKGDTASWDTEQVRRKEIEETEKRLRQVRRKKQRRRTTRILFIVLYIPMILIISALLASFGWKLMSDLCAFNKPLITTTVEIIKEDNIDSVADKLEQAGLIEYPWFFKLFGKFANAEENIGIGTYELNTDMDYRALIVGMRSASGGNMNAETVDVTIPEGYTVMQTIQLLAKNGVNTEEALLKAAQTANFDYDFIDNDSEDITRLEGYLFPDTYQFYVGHNAKDALGKLLSNFNNKLNALEDDLAAAKTRGYDLEDIVIIASLIEKETDGTDHSNIASVIYNRLENVGETAHLLQIDAALLYGLPDHEGALTNDDKAVDTPYNLYMHQYLPPTAIANPGLDSLKAAVNPAETNYYFYALGKNGVHKFSETLAEHNNFLNSGNYGG
ncbi:MAG: endolytic transglycosylase MltG [Oscillibacter sp.]|nr:endolytic transglycosylase MltG [Oscillibacter sp.]